MESDRRPGASFPVEWEQEDDGALAWLLERWHSPYPITPLSHDIQRIVYRGFTRALDGSDPPRAQETRRINTYMYVASRPREPDDPGHTGGPQPLRMENHATWNRKWLPEVQGYLEQWRTFPRENASAGRLLDHVSRALGWFERCWEIHDRIELSTSALVAFCAEHFAWDEERARDLLTGIESLTSRGDDALRQLAGKVRGSLALSRRFLELEPAALRQRLAEDREGRHFLAGLEDFLGEYGRRSDNWVELAVPGWLEDPSPVLAIVKAYVSGGEPAERGDRGHLAASLADEARALLAASRRSLREEFETELAFARVATQLNEEHNHWIDQQTPYWLRQDFLRAGALLVDRGSLADRDDVFLLWLDEVRRALAGDGRDLRPAVWTRRAAMERWQQVSPPSLLGAPMGDELRAWWEPLFGGVKAAGAAREIRGQPASRGVATGVARVLSSLQEAHRLGNGEILVSATTSPPWTPLFRIAAAIVTDGGGRLSHAAVMAREYGVPAVVGTVNATSRIRDGQLIRVDGAAGIVELLE